MGSTHKSNKKEDKPSTESVDCVMCPQHKLNVLPGQFQSQVLAAAAVPDLQSGIQCVNALYTKLKLEEITFHREFL